MLEDTEDAERGRGMVEQIKVVQIKTEKKKAKKKKRTIEQVEKSSEPKDGGKRLRRSEEIKRIEMEWPCEDDSMEWFSGTLHTSFQNGKQFITFDNKNRKYHVASVQGLVVRFTQDTLKQRINVGDRPFNIRFK